MTEGLDGRHRDEDGTISRKRNDTLMSTLQATYPELGRFRGNDTLGDVLRREGVDSLSQLLRKES
jgi:hypothetical protein